MNETAQRSARIETIAMGLLLVFFMLVAALVFWTIVRAPALMQRGDNPRVVEAELRILRGRIIDADGVVLAETVGSDDALQRHYPIASIGPAVGYYSFRHGTSGVEQGYDDVLRGESEATWDAVWSRALHRSQIGQDVRLTLDADWQAAAEALMGDRTGALVILSVPDGAVKVMVSHPGYDPNQLDEQFVELTANSSAPLLNRVTQGRYQPGLALQPFVLASVVDRGLVRMDEQVDNAGAPLAVRDQLSGCRETPPDEATWSTVLQYACPAPMVSLIEYLNTAALTQAYERFGLYSQPDFPMQTADSTPPPVAEARNAILGQESLTVTPLQMARAWASLASGGLLPTPYLVSEVQNEAGVWLPPDRLEVEMQAVDDSAASSIMAGLAQYGDTILEHSVAALSGPQAAITGWYLGFTPARSPQYAVVVVIEGAADAAAAQEIGRSALRLMPAPE